MSILTSSIQHSPVGYQEYLDDFKKAIQSRKKGKFVSIGDEMIPGSSNPKDPTNKKQI